MTAKDQILAVAKRVREEAVAQRDAANILDRQACNLEAYAAHLPSEALDKILVQMHEECPEVFPS